MHFEPSTDVDVRLQYIKTYLLLLGRYYICDIVQYTPRISKKKEREDNKMKREDIIGMGSGGV